MMPGLTTGKTIAAWGSQVRWPWGEKTATTKPIANPDETRRWRDAATADRCKAKGDARWVSIIGLGASTKAVALLPTTLETAFDPDAVDAPSMEFDFDTKAGDAEALVDFLPTFRLVPGMKLRVSVRVVGGTAQAMEVPGSDGSQDERGTARANAVQDNYARLRVKLANLSAGKHTLSIAAIDPGAVIDRVSLPE
jgi:hypothetical protein